MKIKFPPRHFLRSGLMALLSASVVSAQQDMETTVPANWAASTGALSISNLHYKLGSQSLRWNWTGGDFITVSNPGITAADVTNFNKHTCDFWLWNDTALPGQRLRIEFMNGTTAQYWFDFYLDYTGWRRAVRSYVYDMAKATSRTATFTSVRISAPASGSGSFYLDAVRWVGDRFTRVRDAQNVDITGFLSQTDTHAALANVPDIAATAPTPAELSDLAALRTRWLAATKGSSAPSTATVTAANASFAAMNIAEDADGIRGKVVGQDTAALESWPLTLARDYAFGSATATASRDKMLQLARHLLDQGLAYNSSEGAEASSASYDFRELPKALILMAPAYDATTKARLWDFLRWRYVLGEYWIENWARDTDPIHTGVFQILGAILFLTSNDTEAVRMMKGFKRHLEQFVIPTQGSDDGIKPDGLGFHHRSHYNGYLYAFTTLSNTLYHLRGTGFQVDAVSYQRLRAAFLALMRMSADAAGTSVGYYAQALSGRNAFATDLPFARDDLRRLGEWGGNISGQGADSVIAQAYNRRFGVNDYALFTPYGVEPAPDGMYQFNYSPLGIYRRANWVASIRGTQRYFWSSEIYATRNRYGRYQSYGALEVLYHGGIAMSGQQLAGWDWNHFPGTTTIVLPNNKLVAESDREDVRSAINFAGALAFHDDQSGVYACNFQEKNAGANHNPSFGWRKSWFCFENQIVCLGSDIANNDAANPTTTTLFQGRLATPGTAIALDGNALTTFPLSSTAASGSAHWLLDAQGTGYFVQPGASVKISRATQTSANESGSGAPTIADFAKAWLDHGTAPAGASYEYVVFPGTDSARMASVATQHGSTATKPYEVIQRDRTAHVVKWKADERIGYAIYATTALPAATRNAGLLISVARPCLVMTQPGPNGDAWISVVDPDLNFSNPEAGYGIVDASAARSLDLTVNGVWTLDRPPAGASIVGTTATSTTLRVTTQHGFRVNLHLQSSTPVRPTVSNPQMAMVGSGVVLSVTATGNPPPSFQWLKDGVAVPGATDRTLTLSSVSSSNAGSYSVSVSNSSGSVVSAATAVTAGPASSLSNLSVRTTLAAGQTLIVGAVVSGGEKNILIRAAGPALNSFGLVGMVDPRLELFSGSTMVGSNDNWSSTLSGVFTSVGAFSFAPGSSDAAMQQSINGALSVQARGTGPGAVLVEAYDASGGFVPRLVNLSARNTVGSGSEILIAGFAIGGTGTKQVLIRAVGPTLTAFGVSGVLADPKLQVFNGSSKLLAENDDWAASLAATFTSLGAFPLNPGSRDAALLVTLDAGASYTVQVSGADGGTGEALIEIYEVF